MLATHLGFYNTSSTRTHVRFQFSTHAAAGGNVAPNSAFEAADIRIYRANDGAAFSATQRSSANGITMTSPFDSLTGFHDVDIDLTDNTDAGFYASGYLYSVVLAPDETVDSQTLTGVVLAYFEIGVQPVNVTQFGGTAGTFSGGRPEVNTSHAAGTAWNSGAIGASTLASDTIAAAKIASGAITAAKFAAGAIDAAAIANGAIDAATFAADVDAEILSYLVDDATRIDASALNTLSGHDPGETIMGATDLVSANVTQISGDTTAADNLEAALDGTGGVTITAALTGNVTGNLSGSVGSVTGNVGGNVTGSVGSLAAQAKADVNAEVDTALSDYDAPTRAEATSDKDAILAILGTPADTDIATDISNISAGGGATAQEVWEYADRQLTALDEDVTAIDLDAAITAAVAAIKAKTDQLTFTVAGQVDANVQTVNDVALIGDGSATPWGPAP